MSCKVFRKQRWLKLHQNGFRAPSVRLEVRGTQPAESQFRVKNPEPLLFPMNCVMLTEDVRKRVAKGTVLIIPGWSFSSQNRGGGVGVGGESETLKMVVVGFFSFFLVLLLMSYLNVKSLTKKQTAFGLHLLLLMTQLCKY